MPQPHPLRAILFANGVLTDHQAAGAALAAGDRLIAADGGLAHMRALGLTPDIIIGDLDSVDLEEAARLEAAGVRVVRHPPRKDETDLELALRLACAEGARDVLIFGALGGRWDQTLANLLLLGHPDFRATRIRLLDGHQQIYLIQGQTVIEGKPGDTVSLIALGGDAEGVTTAGLEYPLNQGRLAFGSTLGISNVLSEPEATVTVEQGLVVCVVVGQETAADGSAGR
ncbi:MAG: thiamine diphosphokinase [Anaerolineales bacterium]|nr:thiamine diphosphokinase [Anaerolineales bacterium]